MNNYVLSFRCRRCNENKNVVSTKTVIRPDGAVRLQGKCPACRRTSCYDTTLSKVMKTLRSIDVSPAMILETFEQEGPPH